MEPVTFTVVSEGSFPERGSSSNAPGQWWHVDDGRSMIALHECSLMMARNVDWTTFGPSPLTRRFGVASLGDLEVFLENGAWGVRERVPTNPPGVFPLMSPITRIEASALVEDGVYASHVVKRHLDNAAMPSASTAPQTVVAP